MKKVLLVIFLTFIFLIFICVKIDQKNKAGIYDVILFWGQSNMIGSASNSRERYNNENLEEVENMANVTGIDIDILTNTTAMNYTRVVQTPKTVYEYKYISNNLKEISEKTIEFGENLIYNKLTKKIEPYIDENDSVRSSSRSQGVNMIPEFSKTYYEATGHKVVAVMSGIGGQPIEAFLPQDDIDHGIHSYWETEYVYETIKEKYSATIKYLENNGYTIGNKFYVVAQGESSARAKMQASEYERIFLKIHNNLKQDLGITKGVIIETVDIIGGPYLKGVEEINKAQEALASKNEDIIIGSTFLYDHYIPDKNTYEKEEYKNMFFVDSTGNKLDYKEAYDKASLYVCYPKNTIHFTSATLSQVGREAAKRLSENLVVKK